MPTKPPPHIYYLELAVRRLKEGKVLTALELARLGVGTLEFLLKQARWAGVSEEKLAEFCETRSTLPGYGGFENEPAEVPDLSLVSNRETLQ